MVYNAMKKHVFPLNKESEVQTLIMVLFLRGGMCPSWVVASFTNVYYTYY